jgi:uncharacterized protein (DUF2236 family)
MPSTKEENKTYYAKHRDKALARQNERWRNMTPEQKEACREYHRAYYRKRHPLPIAAAVIEDTPEAPVPKPVPEPKPTPSRIVVKNNTSGVILSFA